MSIIILDKPKKFFGIVRRWPIIIAISTHDDKDTHSRAVHTKMEYDIADELRDILTQQFPGFISFWAELFGINVQTPGILIKGSPLYDVQESPSQGSLILIGGPTRNKLTKYFLKNGNPLVTFDDNSDKRGFYVHRRNSHWDKFSDSVNIAVLEKLIFENKVVIIAFGYDENGTKEAVQYLERNWQALADKYPLTGFALVLHKGNDGKFSLLEELS